MANFSSTSLSCSEMTVKRRCSSSGRALLNHFASRLEKGSSADSPRFGDAPRLPDSSLCGGLTDFGCSPAAPLFWFPSVYFPNGSYLLLPFLPRVTIIFTNPSSFCSRTDRYVLSFGDAGESTPATPLLVLTSCLIFFNTMVSLSTSRFYMNSLTLYCLTFPGLCALSHSPDLIVLVLGLSINTRLRYKLSSRSSYFCAAVSGTFFGCDRFSISILNYLNSAVFRLLA